MEHERSMESYSTNGSGASSSYYSGSGDGGSSCNSGADSETLPNVVSYQKKTAPLSSEESVETMSVSSSSSSSFSEEGHASTVATETTDYYGCHNGIEAATSDHLRKPTVNKLSFMLDEVHELARMGRNATLRTDNVLPRNTIKGDIFVHVDIDDRVRAKANSAQHKMEDVIVAAIRDDLKTVYSATSQDEAELVLCIVVVVLTDGSMTRSYWHDSKYGIAGLAEIGLVWQLFEADTLKVFGGGLITQREDYGFGLLDFFQNRGEQCLVDKLAPRVANAVMSRIGGSNQELLVEI
jgi:hypothetical protein